MASEFLGLAGRMASEYMREQYLKRLFPVLPTPSLTMGADDTYLQFKPELEKFKSDLYSAFKEYKLDLSVENIRIIKLCSSEKCGKIYTKVQELIKSVQKLLEYEGVGRSSELEHIKNKLEELEGALQPIVEAQRKTTSAAKDAAKMAQLAASAAKSAADAADLAVKEAKTVKASRSAVEIAFSAAAAARDAVLKSEDELYFAHQRIEELMSLVNSYRSLDPDGKNDPVSYFYRIFIPHFSMFLSNKFPDMQGQDWGDLIRTLDISDISSEENTKKIFESIQGIKGISGEEPASSTSAKMFSSMSSVLSSVYEHITPQQDGKGELLGFCNEILNDYKLAESARLKKANQCIQLYAAIRLINLKTMDQSSTFFDPELMKLYVCTRLVGRSTKDLFLPDGNFVSEILGVTRKKMEHQVNVMPLECSIKGEIYAQVEEIIGDIERERQEIERERQEEASIKMQSLFRGFSVREKLRKDSMAVQEKASIKMQSLFRGVSVREKLRKDRMAVKL
jgi:hypothetical protein